MPIEDAGQPYLALALNRRQMRELLSERVLPLLFPGRSLTRLPMQYSRYKAGKEHVALYQLELDPPLDGGAPLATATFGRKGRLRKAHEQEASNGNSNQHSAVFLPEYPCLIEIFPADGELPSLWLAADASRATGLLAAMLPEYRGVAVKRVEVLRYRPGRRCVLRYDIEHAGGALDLVGKLYADLDRAEIVSAKLAALSSQTGGAIKLAAPIAADADSGMLLMERLSGGNLGDQLETTASRAENERGVRAAAASLAAFHRFQLKSDERRSIQTELGKLRSRLDPVRAVAPDLASEIDALLHGVDDKVKRLAPAQDCVIHGEYKPNQLLLSDGKIAVVDLDRACIGDPAIDVGNFAAVLRKEIVYEGHEHLAGLEDVFASEYRAANNIEGITERAALFQTITFLRMLTRHFERAPQQYVRQGEDWPPLVLFNEARRTLALP